MELIVKGQPLVAARRQGPPLPSHRGPPDRRGPADAPPPQPPLAPPKPPAGPIPSSLRQQAASHNVGSAARALGSWRARQSSS